MIRQDYKDDKKHIHVLSFGAGTQSSAMLIKALQGEFDGVIPDYIVFADTGWEPKHVHDWLDKMRKIAEGYGKEIIVARNGNIREDILRSFETGERAASLPLYTKDDDDEGIIRRQCTMEYKITPIERTIRQLLGYEKGQRVKEVVHMWKGISTDEVQRVKPSQKSWIVNEHPFIFDQPQNRSECIAFVERQGVGTPPKSSCIGCPYHNDTAWKEIKDNQPEECLVVSVARTTMTPPGKRSRTTSRKNVRTRWRLIRRSGNIPGLSQKPSCTSRGSRWMKWTLTKIN